MKQNGAKGPEEFRETIVKIDKRFCSPRLRIPYFRYVSIEGHASKPAVVLSCNRRSIIADGGSGKKAGRRRTERQERGQPEHNTQQEEKIRASAACLNPN